MTGINISFANEESPVPGENWQSLTGEERIALVQLEAVSFNSEKTVSIVKASDNGQVTLSLDSVMSARERGTFLLNLEEHLKINIDHGITVWHEPIGDKSSLRNLRGIEVKG